MAVQSIKGLGQFAQFCQLKDFIDFAVRRPQSHKMTRLHPDGRVRRAADCPKPLTGSWAGLCVDAAFTQLP